MIPARYASVRLPGKLLKVVGGKSVLQRTYENACQSERLGRVVVATDDRRIFEHVEGFGGEVVMSSAGCLSGTDRVAEVVEREFGEAAIVVNVQGDEPLLDPEVIDVLVEAIEGGAEMATPVTPLRSERERFDPSCVKCVFDLEGRALYFSRAPLAGAHRHVGVYAFRREFLSRYVRLGATPGQEGEDLEQLKVLEHGLPIHVCVVEDEGVGVDTPEDLKRLEELCKESTFSSPVGSSPH